MMDTGMLAKKRHLQEATASHADAMVGAGCASCSKSRATPTHSLQRGDAND
jgi:hypothetical protein